MRKKVLNNCYYMSVKKNIKNKFNNFNNCDLGINFNKLYT